jgi:hypothetical protein
MIPNLLFAYLPERDPGLRPGRAPLPPSPATKLSFIVFRDVSRLSLGLGHAGRGRQKLGGILLRGRIP